MGDDIGGERIGEVRRKRRIVEAAGKFCVLRLDQIARAIDHGNRAIGSEAVVLVAE